ncbi:DUF1648 domain-containing protein [Priestia taiwanensis]|uniref:DUF1648 domain-containing protein n=1 Tax=Priestia taiwanensis TaxID=1347902 RepID=A0A917AQU4_9BACI|nr:DUF1648 domain-containing protein [Priestia taiwanensis]MBM7363137.1 putative membrane protein [Priestia taiwanensis]GGE67993.1 hypothetical protein GCM10007140_17570 [Priestia taiwanensis]
MRKMDLTVVEKILMTLSCLGVVWMFWYTFYMYPSLPETIPTHYNFQGEPDAYGGKGNLWFIPIVACFLFGLLTLMGRSSHTFHYLVELTNKNQEHVYKNGRLMLHVLSFELITFFAYDTFAMLEGATGDRLFEGGYAIIVLFIVVAITLVFFMVRAIRLKE